MSATYGRVKTIQAGHVCGAGSQYPTDRAMRTNAEIELNRAPVRQIVKDGRWTVPPNERPKGWENIGVREPA